MGKVCKEMECGLLSTEDAINIVLSANPVGVSWSQLVVGVRSIYGYAHTTYTPAVNNINSVLSKKKQSRGWVKTGQGGQSYWMKPR